MLTWTNRLVGEFNFTAAGWENVHCPDETELDALGRGVDDEGDGCCCCNMDIEIHTNQLARKWAASYVYLPLRHQLPAPADKRAINPNSARGG